MTGQSGRRRPRSIFAVILACLVAAAAVYYGPAVAFHALPPSLTGEDERLAELLGIRPGNIVAEIGAGSGALSIALAKRLEPGGRLYSTELSAERRADIQSRVEAEGVKNVVVVEAGETTTGLPDACCDAIFMRNVYHHIGDPAGFNQSVRKALRPGGRLAVIDFPPSSFGHLRRRPEGAARKRSGHGVAPGALVEELEAAGFRHERTIDEWGGRLFLVLFEAPEV